MVDIIIISILVCVVVIMMVLGRRNNTRINKLKEQCASWKDQCEELEKQQADIISKGRNLMKAVKEETAEQQYKYDTLNDMYYELLFAVESKHGDETRHQTALRYICWMDGQKMDGCNE